MSEDPTDRLDEDFAWARKLHQSGMVQDAIESYRAIAARDGKNPLVHHYLGLALLTDDEAEEAVEHLQEALRHDPSNADIWNDFGVASEANNSLEEAEAAFRKCLALKDDLSEPRVSLAHIFLRQGRPKDALKALDPLIRSDNKPAAALRAQAWLQTAKDADGSPEAFNAACEAVDAALASDDPDLIAASHMACFIAAQLAKNEEAQARIAEQINYFQPESIA
ncbi:MAG: tetratricopeptide repeat protein, partial [Pseudomonadota bacterium]